MAPQKKPNVQPIVAVDRRGETGAGSHIESELVVQVPYIYVAIEKAKNLPKKEGAEEGGDYQVEAKFGTQVFKTKTMKETNPEWKEVFFFLDTSPTPAVEITVKDKATVLGSIRLEAAAIPSAAAGEDLAPQWIILKKPSEDKQGKAGGELMLMVWRGSQSDKAYHRSLDPLRRLKVYNQPVMVYLVVKIIEANLNTKDLQPKGELTVEVSVPKMVTMTRPFDSGRAQREGKAVWNQDLLLAVAQDTHDPMVISLVLYSGEKKQKKELFSHKVHLSSVLVRNDLHSAVKSTWYSKDKDPSTAIHVVYWKEGGAHFFDEPVCNSSDFTPSSSSLRPRPVGLLEVGIREARLEQQKTKEGKEEAMDVYCVAKYGRKWARTNCSPGPNAWWQQEFNWEVFDHCTVITIALFNRLKHKKESSGGGGGKESWLGRVRIRISTLKMNAVYAVGMPLYALREPELRAKVVGELFLGIRFSSLTNDWWPISVLSAYSRPLVPVMNQQVPLMMNSEKATREAAVEVIAAALGAADPALHREVVECVLGTEGRGWSERRARVNVRRIKRSVRPFMAVVGLMGRVRGWGNWGVSVGASIGMVGLVAYPEYIMPTVCVFMVLAGGYNGVRRGRRRRYPLETDVVLGGEEMEGLKEAVEEELDAVPTKKEAGVVRRRYDRLRGVGFMVEKEVLLPLAVMAERVEGLWSWRDRRATWIVVVFSALAAPFLFFVPPQIVLAALVIYFFRHPKFHRPYPPAWINFFMRLPHKSELIL